MAPPTIITSFISIQPLEPVLVFASAADAEYFQSHCRQGRILPTESQRWVYLPLPAGLIRVRTARQGDIAYDFDSHRNAVAFNKSIKEVGRIFQSTKEKPEWDRNVYLGKTLK
ncbi:hypothetical protein K432DRAFT_397077 [Lepidopterella palustris CBS 459.81]|uniref:Uncharacterized protein n=1 Tax=Lepidopterella palustris CBS 459.81 TaxID=1314670 RepID=A0A8E2JAQ0_9PEZI|nr:hypothetical protein K432DRAFT_397077 [Lepidopterella palustris CBS 459.81]